MISDFVIRGDLRLLGSGRERGKEMKNYIFFSFIWLAHSVDNDNMSTALSKSSERGKNSQDFMIIKPQKRGNKNFSFSQ